MPKQVEALVRLARAGDTAAFGELSERFRPWLYGVCFRPVGASVAAEDLVQETLVLGMRDLPKLRDSTRFQSWLTRVAVNVCRMHLRRAMNRPEAVDIEDHHRVAPRQGETEDRIEDALANLSARDRRLIALCYGEGLTHRELAEVFSLSTSAVKSRLHRSRERLRKEMLAMMSEREKERAGAAEEGEWRLRTVLLVEPEEELRGALLEGLRGAGYDVVMLPTGEAALEAIDRGEGQFLLLDKHCGEPHWTEALALVQLAANSGKNVPVGVFVDPENKRDVLLAWQCGADFCLTRPPEVAEVVDMVRRVAEARQSQDEHE
jgi:RNA polymerase sigma-70 factor (ECF subfamily)